MKRTIFITGTDTGVGKTVLTALLARLLVEQGLRTAAFKPVCSGSRADARIIHGALGGALALDAINPWHFRAPVAPALAAARQQKSLTLAAVLAHLRSAGHGFESVLVEGAGGLLSPLGTDFDSRDLIRALRAPPVIVAPNRLGVVNHIRLTLDALPAGLRGKAQVVLMTPPRPDAATGSNTRLLARLAIRNVHRLPWLGARFSLAQALARPDTRRPLAALCAWVRTWAH